MKTRQPIPNKIAEREPEDFPDVAQLSALRAWYSGVSAREAVARYLGEKKALGESSRGILGRIKTRLIVFANARHRPDLAALFRLTAAQRAERCDEVSQVIEVLRFLPVPQPMISDDIGLWLPARSIAALRAHGIDSLADLTVRIPRRRRWWISITGLGPARAKQIESLFAAHPGVPSGFGTLRTPAA